MKERSWGGERDKEDSAQLMIRTIIPRIRRTFSKIIYTPLWEINSLRGSKVRNTRLSDFSVYTRLETRDLFFNGLLKELKSLIHRSCQAFQSPTVLYFLFFPLLFLFITLISFCLFDTVEIVYQPMENIEPYLHNDRRNVN